MWPNIKLPNLLKSLTNFVQGDFLDFLSAVVPVIAPVIPAYIGLDNMIHVLHFPDPIAWLGAGVLESLGLVTIHTVFELWDHNDKAGRRDAPVWVAAGAGGFYLAIVITVNILLDQRNLIEKISIAMLSLISVVGGITMAIRVQQKRRVTAINLARAEAEAKEQKDQERAEADAIKAFQAEQAQRQEAERESERARATAMERLQIEMGHKTDLARIRGMVRLGLNPADFAVGGGVGDVGQPLPNGPAVAPPLPNVRQPFWMRSKHRQAFEALYDANPNIGPTEMAKASGINKGTCSDWLRSRRMGTGGA